MALHSTSNLDKYKRNLGLLADKSPNLKDLLDEMQGLNWSLVSGAGANTNIAITGIVTTDTILFVLEFPAAWSLAALLDRTSIASITSAGNIQLTSTTASNKLLVVWRNKDNA